jgi:C4-type Zn-finger protein
MECPNCGSREVEAAPFTEFFPYGGLPNAFAATFPLMSCRDCHFSWRDHRSEEAIESAMALYRARGGTGDFGT